MGRKKKGSCNLLALERERESVALQGRSLGFAHIKRREGEISSIVVNVEEKREEKGN